MIQLLPLFSLVVSLVASDSDAQAVIAKFKEKDPGLAKTFKEAYGYVVFPTVGKGGIGIGAARGKGYVYEHGRLIGRSTLTQVTLGLQLGGQVYSEVVFLRARRSSDGACWAAPPPRPRPRARPGRRPA